jgi:hypothetical protein
LKLFNDYELSDYLKKNNKSIETQILKIEDSEILNSSIDEWNEYFFNKYQILPLILYEESKNFSAEKTKIRQKNYSRLFIDENEYYEEEGIKVTYTIPFTGNKNLWKLKPTTFLLRIFEIKEIIQIGNEETERIVIEFEFTNSTLKKQTSKIKEYVDQYFEQQFRPIREMIQYVNNDIEKYNSNLKNFIKEKLENRRNTASTTIEIFKELQIPLVLRENSPNIKPIPLKKMIKPSLNKPKIMSSNEYYISDEDYENINNIIHMSGTTMERTARTYYNNNEEELRDILLIALDTHYTNAYGETFRKIGKTDILIEFENKAAFIGECKIWHGDIGFKKAIQQLLNYSTWKDVKISLIIFNKNNKNFKNILEKIEEWCKKNTSNFLKKQGNFFKCHYYRKDMEITIKLNILVFDLYVDETQFKDYRN